LTTPLCFKESATSATCSRSQTETGCGHACAPRGRSTTRPRPSSSFELLAAELDRGWPDAARSTREGLGDTLTLMRLGITGQLAKTLCSTNPCESMIEIVRYTQRNVKRWRDGDMRKRWTAAGMLVAEQQFRRIIGYPGLAKLVIAVGRHAVTAAHTNLHRAEVHEPITV
jgi:hypothetical protein